MKITTNNIMKSYPDPRIHTKEILLLLQLQMTDIVLTH